MSIEQTPHTHMSGTRSEYTHSHAWAEVPHNHMLRAICLRSECEGAQTHNIHSAPPGVDEAAAAAEEAEWETAEAVEGSANIGKATCTGDPCICTNGIGCVTVPVDQW